MTGTFGMHYAIMKNFPRRMPPPVKILQSAASIDRGGFEKRWYKIGNQEIILYKNKNAWLNQILHKDFITEFCDRLSSKFPGKKCLLFLDNFSGHKISYSQYGNLEVKYFRPNMTPYIQPLDMAFFSICKERFKKWRREWLSDERNWPRGQVVFQPPKNLVIEKIFQFLNSVSRTTIRGLWVTAKLAEKIGGEEEQAALEEQDLIRREYDRQNLEDSLPPPDVEPEPPAPEVDEPVQLMSPPAPVPLPQPVFLSPPPVQNFVTVPSYNPFFHQNVVLQITPERRVQKLARNLF